MVTLAQPSFWWQSGILHKSMADTQTQSDESLVGQALADRQAFAFLVERYEAPLGRYFYRLGVGDPEDRQDLLQDTFIKAYRNLASFDTSLKFSSWLYRIAHNETVSWFRKRSIRPEGHAIADADEVLRFVEGLELGPAEQFKITEDQTAVTKALTELPERYRTVLILRFMEHKEYEEISDILTIPVATVGTLIHRGKAALKKILIAQNYEHTT